MKNCLGLAFSACPLLGCLVSGTPTGITGAGISYTPTTNATMGMWGKCVGDGGSVVRALAQRLQ